MKIEPYSVLPFAINGKKVRTGVKVFEARRVCLLVENIKDLFVQSELAHSAQMTNAFLQPLSLGRLDRMINMGGLYAPY